MLERRDEDLRGLLTRAIARRGFAPPLDELAAEAGLSESDAEASLYRLADAHALLLHPGVSRPWVVHPFALAPASCWVDAAGRGYWASCLYCGFGILAALRSDGVVTTRFGGEGETARFEIAGGELTKGEGVFHLATPAARWWDNVVYACSSFQPFPREEDIGPWCARHAMPRGAVLSVERLWRFASDWYGGYLSQPWRKRTSDEARALFARHGLNGAFWAIG